MLRAAGKGNQESNRAPTKRSRSGIEHASNTFQWRARGALQTARRGLRAMARRTFDLLGRFEGSREGCVSCRLVDPDTLPSHPRNGRGDGHSRSFQDAAKMEVDRPGGAGGGRPGDFGRRAGAARVDRAHGRRSRACAGPRSASWARSRCSPRRCGPTPTRACATKRPACCSISRSAPTRPTSRPAAPPSTALAQLPAASAQKHLLLVAKTAKREGVSRAALTGLRRRPEGARVGRATRRAARDSAGSARRARRSGGASGDGAAQQLPRRVGGRARAHRERSRDAQDRRDAWREPGGGPSRPLAVARAGRSRRGRSGARKGASWPPSRPAAAAGSI